MQGKLYDTFVVGRGNYMGRSGNLMGSSVVTTAVYEGIQMILVCIIWAGY